MNYMKTLRHFLFSWDFKIETEIWHCVRFTLLTTSEKPCKRIKVWNCCIIWGWKWKKHWEWWQKGDNVVSLFMQISNYQKWSGVLYLNIRLTRNFLPFLSISPLPSGWEERTIVVFFFRPTATTLAEHTP